MLLFHGTICILKVNLKLSASAPPGMLSSPVQRQPFKMGFIIDAFQGAVAQETWILRCEIEMVRTFIL